MVVINNICKLALTIHLREMEKVLTFLHAGGVDLDFFLSTFFNAIPQKAHKKC